MCSLVIIVDFVSICIRIWLYMYTAMQQLYRVHQLQLVSPSPSCSLVVFSSLGRHRHCRVCSNSCCSCSFEAEIIKIGQSSHKMYSNNIENFQVSTTTLYACTKRSGNLLKPPRRWNCPISSTQALTLLVNLFPSERFKKKRYKLLKQ